MKELISAFAIEKRNRELGTLITRHYQNKELVVIGIMKGAFVFLSDLIREIDLPIKVDFIEASSYEASKVSSGKVKILREPEIDISNKHVLIVEDIIDTGLTLEETVKLLRKKKPASIEICALLLKFRKHTMKKEIRFKGFDIEDHFVVGYGLDFNELYRNLNYVAILEENE